MNSPEDLQALADDIAAVVEEIRDWTLGEQNNGPFAEEAYRTNVHVCTALGMLANRLRSRKEQSR
jgi:hypothetical protein